MCHQCPEVPTVTRWHLQLTHGVVDTVDGPVAGWGYVCHECHPSAGSHGYPTLPDTLTDVAAHIGECAGHG